MIRLTEDSLKPEIKATLEKVFGSACINETTTTAGKVDLYLSVSGYRLIVEVKVGGIGKLTEAIVQASDYARDVRADGTIVLLYGSDARREFAPSRVQDAADAVKSIVKEGPVTALVLSPFWNARFDSPLPTLAREIFNRASRPRITDPELLVDALRESTLEVSSKLTAKTRKPLINEVAASLNLFAELSGDGDQTTEAEGVIADLSAHIFINQILLYHLISTAKVHDGLPVLPKLSGLKELENIFAKIKAIDYRAIYRVDVLSKLPDSVLPIVNRVILALKILRPESMPHDLFGRLFHEFLPFTTRKQLAAFYTRPVAGEILAALAIDSSTKLVLDPACGSGTLLVSAYRRKASLAARVDHQAILREIYGTDIMPFAAHLAALNLTLQDYSSFTDEVMISVGNALELKPGKKIHYTLPLFEHEFTRAGIDYADAGEFKLPKKFDAVIMNPPYTDIKRHISDVLGNFGNAFSPAQNYWAYFLALADSLFDQKGTIAGVLPRLTIFGSDSRAVRRWLIQQGYEFRYLVRSCKETAFTEDAAFRDYLVVLEKRRSRSSSACAIVYIKQSLHMPLEQAADLGSRIREVAEGMTDNKDLKPFENDEFALTWLSNQDIKSDVMEGDDTSLWGSVCWENLQNAAKLNSFYKAMRSAEMTSLVLAVKRRKRFAIRGMEPNPVGMYKSAFIVRPTRKERLSRIVLVQTKETEKLVFTRAFGAAEAKLEKKNLIPGLRSISYINKIVVDKVADWVISEDSQPYQDVLKPLLKPKLNFRYMHKQVETRSSYLAVAKRINFAAAGTCAIAFATSTPMLTSNQLYQVFAEPQLAKRLALWLNGTFVLIHMLQRRSETEGSFSDIVMNRLPDVPVPTSISDVKNEDWAKVVNKFGEVELPSLTRQFESPESFRQPLDEALIELTALSFREKHQLKDVLPSVYRSMADEFKAMKSSMGGGNETTESLFA